MPGALDINSLLTPPSACQARIGLPFKDKRNGAIWYCHHARKNIGKGRKCPPCLCRSVLARALSTNTEER